MSFLFKKLLGKVLKNPLNIIRAGHPLLRVPADSVNPSELNSSKIGIIIEEMKLVFQSRLHPVVGLAAPQVGYSKRIIGYQVLDQETLKENHIPEPIKLQFLINPEITILDKESKASYESCISVPSYSGLVKRYTKINVKAKDLNGKDVNQNFTGFLARIIQHEVDHLNGTMFTDRMESKSLRHDKYISQYEMK